MVSYNKDNKRYNSNHKLKINMLIVSAVTIFSIVLISVFSCYYFKNLSIKNIHEKNSTLVTQISSSVSDLLESIERDLKVLSESKEIKNIIEGKDSATTKVDNFEAYMKVYKEIENLYFATPDKTLYMESDFKIEDEYDPTDKEWYVEAVNTKDYVWSKPFVDIVKRNLIMQLSMPVYSKEELVGVLTADINLNYLDEKLDQIKLGETGYVMLTDENGFIYTSPNKEYIGQNIVADELKHMLEEDFHDVVVSYSENGQNKIAYISDADKGNFKLVGIIEEDEIYGNISVYLNFIILMSILLTTITVVISSFLILKGSREKESFKTENMSYKIEDGCKDNVFKDNLEDKLNRLKEYKLKKVLTEEEYERKRGEIIKNYDI